MLRALFYRRPQTIEPIPIVVDGTVHLVRVKRHQQARRYTLRVLAATREVLLTIPARSSVKDAREFAQKNSGWIAARMRHLPVPAPFSDGELLPLRGVMHRISHRPRVRGTVWVECCKDGSLLCVAGETPHIHRRVSDFLKREARRDLVEASGRYAAALDVKVASISVRDQVSRWGSCSSTGALSFSWRLILAPPHVLDYLAAHEVAHLIEMNHSQRFWKILYGVCPEMERAKNWLDTHGAGLHRYGAMQG